MASRNSAVTTKSTKGMRRTAGPDTAARGSQGHDRQQHEPASSRHAGLSEIVASGRQRECPRRPRARPSRRTPISPAAAYSTLRLNSRPASGRGESDRSAARPRRTTHRTRGFLQWLITAPYEHQPRTSSRKKAVSRLGARESEPKSKRVGRYRGPATSRLVSSDGRCGTITMSPCQLAGGIWSRWPLAPRSFCGGGSSP